MAKRKPTKRQLAYREYLKTDHWKQFRASAHERDGGKCVKCGSTDRVQVHHHNYRFPFETCTLEDVETLCLECHRREHGWAPREFEVQRRILERAVCQRPSRGVPLGEPREWKKLAELIEIPEDQRNFGMLLCLKLIFRHQDREIMYRVRDYHNQVADRMEATFYKLMQEESL